MPCFHPLTAYRTDENEIVFAERGRIHSTVILACGQCVGCRLERSRQWAARCMHEAQLHKHNSFITLTYRPENLPEHGNLRHRDVQLFLKKLRNALCRRGDLLLSSPTITSPNNSLPTSGQHRAPDKARGALYVPPAQLPKIKYYMAGEYGEQFARPHYHICLFGIDFADKIYLRRSPTGNKLWRSPTLEKLWPHGYSSIGEVNFQTAAYVARYVMKKITGTKAKQHYEKIDLKTGEIIKIEKEYNQMSRRPGIGKTWYEKFTTDIYPHGQMIVRGKKTNTPRYYDKLWEKQNPLSAEELRHQRFLEGLHHRENQTPERLRVREQVQLAQLNQLKRKI